MAFLFSFGDFSASKAIAVSPAGSVYVVDTGNNKVKVYSPSGDSIREIGGSGWGQLEFDRPYDIAVGAGLNFYVADYGNHRIQRFDKDLNYISTLYTRESDDPSQRFGYPTSVAMSRLGDLFLLDNENIRVVKVNTFSTIERTFGGIEAGKGRLKNPRKVWVTNQDLVCVLDEQRIVIFDNFGNYVRTIGEGALTDPRGMAIQRDTLYVVDGGTIRLFDSEGKLLEVLTPSHDVQGGSEQSFNDIAVYGHRLYVLTDQEVKVFEWWGKNTLDNH
jgi:DNA-binding beta-propeller fold protein YncE